MIATKIVKLDPLNPQEDYLKEAAEIIRHGGLVIIPTETVYGIACNMQDKRAIKRLCEIKKRPQGKPFSLHLDAKEKVEYFAQHIPVYGYKLMDKFWPGPLTLILKSRENDQSIGVRVPDSDIANKIILRSDVPVVCPSANLAGKPAPINFEQAIKDLEGLVNFAIDTGPTKLQIESSVVDLTLEPWRILREAAIKKEDLEAATKKKAVLFICTGNSCRSVMAQGLLEKRLKERGRQDVEVLSRGIMMLGGLGATEETIELLKNEGIDITNHHSRRVTKEILNKADLILVMERIHEERILQLDPEVKNRLFLLREFAKISGNNLDIADPIGKPREFYALTFAQIKEAIDRIVDII